MYKIGEFSKLVDIPVKTLRYYDQLKVLQPKIIDNFTGYRYYTDENIAECKTIKLLKMVDFSLEEIVLFKNQLTEDIIESKKKELAEKLIIMNHKMKVIEDMILKTKTGDEYDDYEEKEIMVLRRKYEKRSVGKEI